ncbi:MAG: type I methionyl aminopeptidase [Candidatus Saccharimonadales bacterium]
MMTSIKTKQEIADMRISGKLLATVLNHLKKIAVAGVATKDLAAAAAIELRKLGGQPAFLGYQGFPDVLCVSVNDEVVHGIPCNSVLKNGDIVGLDFGVIYNGMITDGAISLIIGTTGDQRLKTLLTTTERALTAGIGALHGGVMTGDIGAAVQAVLDKEHLGIVKDLVGHGVGHNLHEEPNVPNYGRPGTGTSLKSGMTIAIEPMATLGGEGVYVDNDQWTIKTRDGSMAAHFEHTVLITDEGAEVLTKL